MPLTITTERKYPNAVLPKRGTLQEVFDTIPGFIGAFAAEDAWGPSGHWDARYGSAQIRRKTAANTVSLDTRDGLQVVSMLGTDAALQLHNPDGTYPLFTGLTFAMRTFLRDASTADQRVIDIDGRQLLYRPDRSPPIWSFNQGAAVGTAIEVGDTGGWHNMVITKANTASATYGSFDGKQPVLVTEAGADLRNRDLMIGDDGSTSAAMDISRIVVANGGTLTEGQRVAVQAFLNS